MTLAAFHRQCLIHPLTPSFFSTVGVKRDVVFLVDGSRYAAQEFYLIRDLIERIVNNLDVGFDTTRISVVQFSEHPHVEFLLNAHSTKDEVQGAVRRLRPRGGQQVNVGEALEFVAKTIFTRPSGSRIEEGVPQFLVILSSRKSDDDLEFPSVQVKQVGVAPMVIAKNMDPEEMVQISLSPDYVFQVSSFQELPSLEQKLLAPIETLTADQIRQLLGDVTTIPGKMLSLPAASVAIQVNITQQGKLISVPSFLSYKWRQHTYCFWTPLLNMQKFFLST